MAKSGKGKKSPKKKTRIALLEEQVVDLIVRVNEIESFLKETFPPEKILDTTIMIDAEADPDAN